MNSIPFSKTLHLYKGTDFYGSIIVKDINGEPYLLSDGEEITFSIKQAGNVSETPEVQLTITNENEFLGEYPFKLTKEMTSCLDGDYYYYAYIRFADGDNALIVPRTPLKAHIPCGVMTYYSNKNQIFVQVPRTMLTDGNYYTDGEGITHNDIPLGIQPQEAYARTNLNLKSEVDRLEGLISETNDTINSETTRLQTDIDDLNESIGSRITSELTYINSRVDNIIAHNNDTEGNSELIDIRTGADGNVYATAGNAVRVNIGNLKSDFDSVTVSESVFDETEFDSTINGKYMSKSGTEAIISGGIYGAITVHTGEKYKIKAEVGVNIRTYVITDANGTVTRYADEEVYNTKHNYNVEITISSAEDGGTLYVSSIHADYFGLKKETRVCLINKDKIPDFPYNPLFEKTAVFNGDSICAGLTVGSSHPTYGYGWAGRIGTKNNMTWKNYGVSGGTVTTDTYNWTSVPAAQIDYSSGQTYYRRVGSSASGTDTMYVVVPENEWNGTSGLFVRGNARHWESTTIDTMYAEYPDADYVILESCLNDGFNGVPKGTLDTSDFSPSVTTNFTSAMEYMINRALTLFPNAKIGVIIPHRGSNTTIAAYQDITRAVCAKWGIPYIDLYKGSGICYNNTTQRAVMFDDNTHLTAAGYDMITSKIEAWMKTL